MHFEDIPMGDTLTSESHKVDYDEMLAFNRRWDDLPIHVSEQAAQKAGYKTILASGQYTLCVKQSFVTKMPWAHAIIGAIAFEELKFHSAVYPEDVLSMTSRCLDKRPSRSKPDRGIVKFLNTMTNQDNQTVLEYVDVVLIATKPT